MQAIGFIGCGRIGRVLVEALLGARALRPAQVVVSTRTPERVHDLPLRHHGLRLAAGNAEVARDCDRIFLAVGPVQVPEVLAEVAPVLRPGAHLVSLAACVSLEVITRAAPVKVTRVIPSVTASARSGVSLVCHNALVGADDARYIDRLLAPVSEVMVVDEADLDAATTLTSSAPAFVAAACQEVARAVAAASGIPPARAERMVLATLWGTARLLWEQEVPPDELIDRVATRGGITEEGIHVLRRDLPAVLDAVLAATSAKTALVEQAVDPA